jgi:O-antigen/teichoic acid export membrane protein
VSGRLTGTTFPRRLMGSRLAGQALLFTASNVLIGFLGAASKALLARLVTVNAFGTFAFVASFVELGALVFEFGLFLPAGRMAARADREERPALMGAAMLLFLPVGVVFGLFVFGASFLVDELFQVHAAGALRALAPLAFVYPFYFVAVQLAQAVDRLNLYSLTTAAGQLLFVAVLAAAIAAGAHMTVDVAVALRAAALGIGMVWLVVGLRPVVRGARRHLGPILEQTRAYGFQVYVGRLLSIGTYNMDVLMLAVLRDPRTVAFYSLAGAYTALITLPSAGLSNALFGRLTREPRLERRWLAASWALGLTGAVVAWALAGPVIGAVFGAGYRGAVHLVAPLGLAAAVRGVTSFYNVYLAAQARGRDLRNAGLVLTASNLVFNFALIPPFGAAGAAWASLLALLANLAAHVVAYRRCRALPQEAGV